MSDLELTSGKKESYIYKEALKYKLFGKAKRTVEIANPSLGVFCTLLFTCETARFSYIVMGLIAVISCVISSS